jgi:hypothetical protein
MATPSNPGDSTNSENLEWDGWRERHGLPFDSDELLEKMAELNERESLLTLLLVGSYAEKLQSSSSDVDLVFVKADGALEPATGSVLTFHIRGTRVEVWVLAKDDLVARLSLAARPSYRGTSLRDLELTHKLVKAVSLVGAQRHAELVKGLLPIFDVRMVDYFAQSGEGIFRDIVGAIEAHDSLTAAVQAREVVGFAAEAYLASLGDTYPKRKWRARRISRNSAAAPQLKERFLLVEFGGPSDRGNGALLTWLHTCLSLVRDFQMECYFQGKLSRYERIEEPARQLLYIYRVREQFCARTVSGVFALDARAACALYISTQIAPRCQKEAFSNQFPDDVDSVQGFESLYRGFKARQFL